MIPAIAEQDLILNLQAAGFDEPLLRAFLDCWKGGKTAEQLRLLAQKRHGLLEQVHRAEKKILCLDYLVYQIEQAENH